MEATPITSTRKTGAEFDDGAWVMVALMLVVVLAVDGRGGGRGGGVVSDAFHDTTVVPVALFGQDQPPYRLVLQCQP